MAVIAMPNEIFDVSLKGYKIALPQTSGDILIHTIEDK